MTSSKKHLYAGLLLLGGLALFVDRFLLAEGVTPMAPSSVSAAPPLAVPPLAAPLGPLPELPFPRNLPELPTPSLRDPFVPPSHLAPPPTASEAPPESAQSDRKSLAARHALRGVIITDGLKIAIINGQWLRVGETIEGCTLLDVIENEARFWCHDGGTILKVDVPNDRNAR